MGLGAMILSCGLVACAVGPSFERPATPRSAMTYNYQEDPTGTIAADGTEQHFSRGAEIAADWWRLFNCPKLDAVVLESIANNPSLQAAQASLRQSEDNLRAGYGIFFPRLARLPTDAPTVFVRTLRSELHDQHLQSIYALNDCHLRARRVWRRAPHR